MAHTPVSLAVPMALFAMAGLAGAAEQAGVAAPAAAAAVPTSSAAGRSAPVAAAASRGRQKPAAASQPQGAARPTAGKPEGQDARPAAEVHMSGMSVLGNDDSPKSLVIVPWKASQLGDMPGLSRLLDDGTQPVDKEVFLRELSYYHIKMDSK